MKLEILNVGDGACTVVTSAHSRQLMIIDCGARPSPPGSAHAASAVSTALGERLQNLETLVITHFDADHWVGFLDLAATHVPSPDSGPIRIYFPNLPKPIRPVQTAFMALVAFSSSTDVFALDLVAAWRTAAGGHVQYKAVSRGDTIQHDGSHWNVLWPPRRFDAQFSRSIGQMVRELGDLADELAAEGDARLRNNLQPAYGLFSESDDDGDYEAAREDERDFVLSEDDDRRNPSEDDDEEPFWRSAAGTIPQKFRERFEVISGKLQRANNRLSLVVEDPSREFVSFGDLETSGLSALLRAGGLRHRYEVILSPHHGTHPVRSGFPESRYCIGQTGVQGTRFRHKHNHNHQWWTECVTTHELGNITLNVARTWEMS